ncbi:hypothetical protein PMAYCL1PPCAC_15446, partial [Pristionchus mayeri]
SSHRFNLAHAHRVMEGEVSRSCLICSSTITMGHMGIDACRACAAFFKRCKEKGKLFLCRQGNGKCTFRKHQKFMCRSCRYEKCIHFGMTFDSPIDLRILSEGTKEEIIRPSVIRRMENTHTSTQSVLDKVRSCYDKPRSSRLKKERDYLDCRGLQRPKR